MEKIWIALSFFAVVISLAAPAIRNWTVFNLCGWAEYTYNLASFAFFFFIYTAVEKFSLSFVRGKKNLKCVPATVTQHKIMKKISHVKFALMLI